MEEEHLNLGKSTVAQAILLLDKAFSYLGGRSGYSEEEKAKLSQDLHTIHRGYGEKPLPRCPGPKVWHFRRLVEYVEDAIDDIEYKYLSHRLEEEVRHPISKFVKTKIFNKVARVAVRSSNLQQLRSAIRALDYFASGYAENIALDSSGASQQPSLQRQRATGDVFGRDKEKEQIVHWVTQVASSSPISCFAIVGMAGMGKTALAQLVHEDSRVSVNFDYVVWVPQAVDLGAEAITTEILRSIGFPARSRIDSMQYYLAEKLRGKKILLILDDVWEDESTEKWANLVSPLRSAMRGSKILLTTRMQSVADMAADVVGGEAEFLTLDELDEHSNFLLFKSELTPHIKFEDHADLLLVGEQIAQKFGGCPILTLAITSQLKDNILASYWRTILHEEMHNITGMHGILMRGILQVLQLSYDRLPRQLKACFKYCGIFPNGYRFSKEELVNMWVCSGLIPFVSSKPGDIGLPFASPKPGDSGFPRTENFSLPNPEDVGQQCFRVLTRKSFFCRVLGRDPSNGDQKEYYVLHRIMHYFAEFVSQGECARINGYFRNYFMESSIRLEIQHLSIDHFSNITEHNIKYLIGTFWRLRTLIIRSETCLDQQTEVLLEKWLGKLAGLRLLYLDVPSLSHALVGVSNLTQLRYLFLFSCDGYHIQKAFKLYHLQVFKLNYLTGKEAGFHGIYNLHSLRCLHVPDNMLSNIHDVGRLTSLQELRGFDVMEIGGHRLNALSNLTKLEKLSLKNLQNVRNSEEAMEVKLKEKQCIRFLSLSWNKYSNDPENLSSRVLDSLEPNKEIQHLHINGYNGVLLPQWIEKSLPINLVLLELEYCMKWKTLPSLKDLNSLKYLKLEHLSQLEYIGEEEHFGTSESEDALLPPFLNTLIVRSCPSLKNLPAIPCTLEQLIIKHVGLEVLPRMHQRYTGSLTFDNWESASASSVKSDLAFLHIESCARLTTLDEGFLKQQEHLQSLATLIIRHCQRLCHLPKKGFTELPRLNILEMVGCPILRDAKTEGSVLPVSLTNLDINPCGDIEVSVLMSLQNLTFLRRLSLFSCSNLEKLPSENVFATLNNLYDVSIARCKNLLSLGALGIVATLRVLSILCCDKLHFSYSQQAGCSFKLLKLEIDRQALLLVEPIKSLRYIEELQICDDNAMKSLPGEWLLQNAVSLHSIEIGVAESLCSLPSQMIYLESLQSLHIERAPLIQSLPQMPMSLRKLTIWGCDRMFLKRYEKDVGLDWGRIAHIPDVDMKAYSEGMSCGGDQTQEFNNSTSNPCCEFVVVD
ncbi:putative disease resistance protein RGA4 [Brachypodium distachyon]|uniref:Uncharacterized protein n=1 Tax=Brachypodium distachyon TaxID=15368 RepID=I1II37_BRADI|nr:putative disease resistance protein RGA4 [Brachypodium distachyon]KQJ86585.1 hypothetical protein BRADI_4g06470v3 [Brachypodium distachyon]|eukprot:XP_003575483.1 putative disease resistance protein RGA4 [Brachypodium distachyon]